MDTGIILVILVAILVFAGKKVLNKKKNNPKPISTPSPVPSIPEPEPPIVEPEPNFDPPIEPEPEPPIIEAEPDPLKLIEWEGDTEYCKFEMWPLFKQYYNNRYLVKITQDIIKMASKIVYDEFGLPTILVDLSSNYEVNIDPVTNSGDNGHPGKTHNMGNGADIHYHGWPIQWKIKATIRWLQIVKKCLPEFKVFVGPKTKEEIERTLNKYHLHWIIPDTDYEFGNAHDFNKEISSHYHCYLMRPWLGEPLELDWDAINELKSQVLK